MLYPRQFLNQVSLELEKCSMQESPSIAFPKPRKKVILPYMLIKQPISDQ